MVMLFQEFFTELILQSGSVMEETKLFPESPRALLGMKNHYTDSERRYNLHP